MTREQVNEYLITNGSDIIHLIAEHEVQDILYNYEDDEIIERLDELIAYYRKIK